MKALLLNLYLSFICITFSTSFLFTQQVLVNESWISETAAPENINFSQFGIDVANWSMSVVDNNKNLIITGNTVQSSGDTDIFVAKYGIDGNTLWEYTYDGVNAANDYGITLTIDTNNNIYVAGTTTGTDGFLDYCILKISSTGNLLWVVTWGAAAGVYDLPASIAVNNNDEIVVAGGTLSSEGEVDVSVLKLSSIGQILWTANYDYANLHDIPLSLQILTSGNVIISGISSPVLNAWDHFKITLDIGNGSLIEENRNNIPNIQINDALAFTYQDHETFYLAGVVEENGNKNIQLVKISHDHIEWIRNIDYLGFDDFPKALALDNDENIYISGEGGKSTGEKDIFLTKYSPTGDLTWQKSYASHESPSEAVPTKLLVTNSGDVFLAGWVKTETSGRDFILLMYSKDGHLFIDKKYSGGTFSDDIPTDMKLVGDQTLYLTGTSLGSNSKYNVLRYDFFKTDSSITSGANESSYRSNQLIVKFDPNTVRTDFVDNNQLRFASIYDILTEDAVLKIETNLGFDFSGVVVSKIYYRLTTQHLYSISRGGNEVPIPKFWSMFLFHFEESVDIDALQVALNQLDGVVEYAEYNNIATKGSLPNDALFQDDYQASLWPTDDFSQGHINIDPAWDIETGENHIMVGVIDDVIDWTHPDFASGGASRVKGGWDYAGDSEIWSTDVGEDVHGTAMAGIIGAVRDNDFGIAGIAGGGSNANGANGSGVELYSFGITDIHGTADQAGLYQAIIDGAMDAPGTENPGFALHLQNLSWGVRGISCGEPYSLGTGIRDAIQFASRNECVIVTIRHNHGGTEIVIPGSCADRLTINVGASGFDGKYKTTLNGDLFYEDNGCEAWASNYGSTLDVIAPGVTELVSTLSNVGYVPTACGWPYIPPPIPYANMFTATNGSSSAAAHVSGVASLMLSYWNSIDIEGGTRYLAPEDVEYLIETYADDIFGGSEGYELGYDEFNGHGRINAGEVMRHLHRPQYDVFHSTAPNNTIVEDMGVIQPNNTDYALRKYSIRHEYTNEFPEHVEILGHWSRMSSVIGLRTYGDGSTFRDADYYTSATFNHANTEIGFNTANITMRTHCYQRLDTEEWIPAPPHEAKTAYSLHLLNHNATPTQETRRIGEIAIFPNPAINAINLAADDEYLSGEATVNIYDGAGRLLQTQELFLDGSNSSRLDITNCPSGVLVVEVICSRGLFQGKVIKTK